MKYQGGKHRIAKDILQIILAERKPGQWFVEPFCGGCNVTAKVDGPRIAGDSRRALIAFWRQIAEGWRPEFVKSKRAYDALKSGGGELAQQAWAAVGASYSGKWFGGFVGYGKHRNGRDYQKEAFAAAVRKKESLADVTFYALSYDLLPLPPQSVIYCDPPYAGTTDYGAAFDSESFYDWCRDKAKEGHVVFVSEYSAPADFVCVWEKPVTSSLNGHRVHKPAVEKLFRVIP